MSTDALSWKADATGLRFAIVVARFNAGITENMPMTGGRADIGPTTEANTIWLMAS